MGTHTNSKFKYKLLYKQKQKTKLSPPGRQRWQLPFGGAFPKKLAKYECIVWYINIEYGGDGGVLSASDPKPRQLAHVRHVFNYCHNTQSYPNSNSRTQTHFFDMRYAYENKRVKQKNLHLELAKANKQ